MGRRQTEFNIECSMKVMKASNDLAVIAKHSLCQVKTILSIVSRVLLASAPRKLRITFFLYIIFLTRLMKFFSHKDTKQEMYSSSTK